MCVSCVSCVSCTFCLWFFLKKSFNKGFIEIVYKKVWIKKKDERKPSNMKQKINCVRFYSGKYKSSVIDSE